MKYTVKISFLLITILMILSSCSKGDYDNYEFDELLGVDKDSIINQFGDIYLDISQGVNRQNEGIEYTDLGIIFGFDEMDKVIEIELTNIKYKAISTMSSMGEAISILDTEHITLQISAPLGTGPTLWSIYDFGDYRLRLSGYSVESSVVEVVVTLEDFK